MAIPAVNQNVQFAVGDFVLYHGRYTELPEKRLVSAVTPAGYVKIVGYDGLFSQNGSLRGPYNRYNRKISKFDQSVIDERIADLRERRLLSALRNYNFSNATSEQCAQVAKILGIEVE